MNLLFFQIVSILYTHERKIQLKSSCVYEVNKAVVDLSAALASAVLHEAQLSTSIHAVPRLLMECYIVNLSR